MEAHKYYELKERLVEFQNHLPTPSEAIANALVEVNKAIDEYEFERMEKIRQDNE